MKYNPYIMSILAVIATSSVAIAQEKTEPVNMGEKAQVLAELGPKVTVLRAIGELKKIKINGDYRLGTWWLAADEIEFGPGARIIVDSSVSADSREVYIIARNIKVLDSARYPVITWDAAPLPVPEDRGQAGSGAAGQGEGGAGGAGSTGAPGATGQRGVDAPSLTMMFMTLSPGPLKIDLSGAPGSVGGAGQRGGAGGAGAQGSPARQARKGGPFNTTVWLPWCESGPGEGGRGGNGGSGGSGGKGGVGGRGGSATLISLPEFLPTFTQAIRTDVSGGTGGAGGSGGPSGAAGTGGPEGQLANFCNSAGRTGASGGVGGAGAAGEKGEVGTAGRVYVGSLTSDQFKSLFGF